MADKATLEQILSDGAENATRKARKTLTKVYKNWLGSPKATVNQSLPELSD